VNAATMILDRPDAAIAYRRTGEGPPLMLLHATLSSSRQLRRLADQLAAHYAVVNVDRRGSGESTLPADAPLGPIDVAAHVADLDVLIGSLGLGPTLLVGHSYGGCVALELAARRPDRVSAVWAYEPPYAAVSSPPTRKATDAVAASTAAAMERAGPGAAAEAFMAGVSGPDALAALSPAALRRVRQAGIGAIADAALLGMDPDGLEHIECPVLIVTGSQSLPQYAEIATALVQLVGSADTEELSGVDHMAPLLRPDLVVASIEAFAPASSVTA